MPRANPVGRSWCFTLNNPDINIPLCFDNHDRVRYAIYQSEMGESGTPHYQGYIEMSCPSTLRQLQRIVPRAHFERRRGTRSEAREYCRKTSTATSTPVEYGIWTGGQGQRSDLDAVRLRLDAGDSELEIAEAFFSTWCRFNRSFRLYKRLKLAARPTNKPNVVVIWGPTGVGKSRYCHTTYPNAYWKMPNKWWDGYDGHADIIMDDFYGWIRLAILLRLLDHYPVQMETKGGHTQRTVKNIIVTSNRCPEHWYNYPTEELRLALFRRFDKVYNLVKKCNELICVDADCLAHSKE